MDPPRDGKNIHSVKSVFLNGIGLLAYLFDPCLFIPRYIAFYPANMTPEIICSIVFGTVASVLAFITTLQARSKGLASGTLQHPVGV